jgi:hypothetical protein
LDGGEEGGDEIRRKGRRVDVVLAKRGGGGVRIRNLVL